TLFPYTTLFRSPLSLSYRALHLSMLLTPSMPLLLSFVPLFQIIFTSCFGVLSPGSGTGGLGGSGGGFPQRPHLSPAVFPPRLGTPPPPERHTHTPTHTHTHTHHSETHTYIDPLSAVFF